MVLENEFFTTDPVLIEQSMSIEPVEEQSMSIEPVEEPVYVTASPSPSTWYTISVIDDGVRYYMITDGSDKVKGHSKKSDLLNNGKWKFVFTDEEGYYYYINAEGWILYYSEEKLRVKKTVDSDLDRNKFRLHSVPGKDKYALFNKKGLEFFEFQSGDNEWEDIDSDDMSETTDKSQLIFEIWTDPGPVKPKEGTPVQPEISKWYHISTFSPSESERWIISTKEGGKLGNHGDLSTLGDNGLWKIEEGSKPGWFHLKNRENLYAYYSDEKIRAKDHLDSTDERNNWKFDKIPEALHLSYAITSEENPEYFELQVDNNQIEDLDHKIILDVPINGKFFFIEQTSPIPPPKAGPAVIPQLGKWYVISALDLDENEWWMRSAGDGDKVEPHNNLDTLGDEGKWTVELGLDKNFYQLRNNQNLFMYYRDETIRAKDHLDSTPERNHWRFDKIKNENKVAIYNQEDGEYFEMQVWDDEYEDLDHDEINKVPMNGRFSFVEIPAPTPPLKGGPSETPTAGKWYNISSRDEFNNEHWMMTIGRDKVRAHNNLSTLRDNGKWKLESGSLPGTFLLSSIWDNHWVYLYYYKEKLRTGFWQHIEISRNIMRFDKIPGLESYGFYNQYDQEYFELQFDRFINEYEDLDHDIITDIPITGRFFFNEVSAPPLPGETPDKPDESKCPEGYEWDELLEECVELSPPPLPPKRMDLTLLRLLIISGFAYSGYNIFIK